MLASLLGLCWVKICNILHIYDLLLLFLYLIPWTHFLSIITNSRAKGFPIHNYDIPARQMRRLSEGGGVELNIVLQWQEALNGCFMNSNVYIILEHGIIPLWEHPIGIPLMGCCMQCWSKPIYILNVRRIRWTSFTSSTSLPFILDYSE